MTTPRYSGPPLKIAPSPVIGSVVLKSGNRLVEGEITQDMALQLQKALGKALGKPRFCRKGGEVTPAEYQGISLLIDRPKGFVQHGVSAEGLPWTREYQCDYGYIPDTQGGDDEPLDVFLGEEDLTSVVAYLIVQVNDKGDFDEFKLMLGFRDGESALAMYLKHVPAKYLYDVFVLPTLALQGLLGVPPKVLKSRAGEDTTLWKSDGEHKISVRKTMEEGYLLGIVLVPEEKDLQDDIYSEDEVRKAAHEYMLYHRNIGNQHKQIIVHGRQFSGEGDEPISLVESYVTPAGFTLETPEGPHEIRKGTWLMGFRVNDPG